MFEQSQIDAIDDHKTAPTPNVYTHTMIRIKDAVKSLEFLCESTRVLFSATT